MKFELSKEWCLNSARLEGDSEVGVGVGRFMLSDLVDYSKEDWTDVIEGKVVARLVDLPDALAYELVEYET